MSSDSDSDASIPLPKLEPPKPEELVRRRDFKRLEKHPELQDIVVEQGRHEQVEKWCVDKLLLHNRCLRAVQKELDAVRKQVGPMAGAWKRLLWIGSVVVTYILGEAIRWIFRPDK